MLLGRVQTLNQHLDGLELHLLGDIHGFELE